MSVIDGALDLHVHSYPDFTDRAVNDFQMSRLATRAGMVGYVLKSHYAPTAERAWLVNQVAPDVRAIGAIVLNHFVGGLNPLAVEALARAGGRVVFMPTIDAANEASLLEDWSSERPLPPYLSLKKELKDTGRLRQPISLLDDAGHLTEATHMVIEVVRDKELVLATGHISTRETMVLVRAAHRAGVQRILVTHPESPHINIPVDAQVELARYGAVFERCFAYLADATVQAKAFAAIRVTGVEHNALSSDLGTITREDPVTGLERFFKLTLEEGFTHEEAKEMFCRVPARLIG